MGDQEAALGRLSERVSNGEGLSIVGVSHFDAARIVVGEGEWGRAAPTVEDVRVVFAVTIQAVLGSGRSGEDDENPW